MVDWADVPMPVVKVTPWSAGATVICECGWKVEVGTLSMLSTLYFDHRQAIHNDGDVS